MWFYSVTILYLVVTSTSNVKYSYPTRYVRRYFVSPQHGCRHVRNLKSTSRFAQVQPEVLLNFYIARSLHDHSHSIVAIGFGLISKHTRHTPSTSFKIRSVIFLSTAQSISGTVHTIASTVFTARMITGQ